MNHYTIQYPQRPPQLVSDAGIQVEIRQEAVSPVVPIVVPPPPPPQAPTLAEMLKVQSQKPRKPVEEITYQPRPRPGLEVQRRNQNMELVEEITNTLGKNAGEILRPSANRSTRVTINEKSSPEDVTRWLQEKGFSPRVIDLLDGQDGANLFSLSKLHLQQACGRDEGAYLYSQLLVQKKRSGFRTHTGDELKAILSHRRNHVELSNEAPVDEPVFTINPIH
uniref:SAM_3 domain-containing protein n=1 Tax=Caenorhabditis japonica TaxID=281687 RepID=A0A8R1I747_CAEJA